MDAKELFLRSEGDAHFRRNFNPNRVSCAKGTQFLSGFLDKNPELLQESEKKSVLEIGCDYGFNLMYLNQKFGLKCYGVEPSMEAVEFGRKNLLSKKITAVELVQGTSDYLPFEENSMDFVILGFFMYCVDRSYLLKTAAEADRVLKRGGFLVMEDFDVPISCKRAYKHNPNIYTYKSDYTKLFAGDPSYTLIEKTTYSGASMSFDPTIQERVSSSILYKEHIEDVYQLIKEG